VLNEVGLNQVLVAFGDVATTQRVVAALQAEGTCWCGITVWQGRTAMRISVSSWTTTDAKVERSLGAMWPLHAAPDTAAAIALKRSLEANVRADRSRSTQKVNKGV